METSRRASLGGGSLRRSILKKDTVIDVRDDLDRALAASASSETPEQWFQRVLRARELSPLDLCDRFCYGDARRHDRVSIKHVCEVLFELDEPGRDPTSDAMEEFLYRFSYDRGDGEIVVDIKEALRTLGIWKITGPVSPKHPNPLGSPQSTLSPAKAAILEVKAEKLKQVIDSLQQENLRLSRALSSAKDGESPQLSTEPMGEARPPSPLRIGIKKPLEDKTPVSSLRPSSLSRQQQPTPPTVVSRHERELIALANRLEYSGVKRLEELLHKDDKLSSGGFVSLKQLRWLLVHECGLGTDVSEAKLMELCLGMNFNTQGQLDYNEFVRVLLDILIYESRPRHVSTSSDQAMHPPTLSEADEALLTKTRAYLRGLYGSPATTRSLLDALCDKYDLEGNQSLSLTEMTRAFQSDLARQHPVNLQLPLTQSETRRLLLSLAEISGRPIVNKAQRDHSDAVFVYYPAILDAIFRVDAHPRSAYETDALLARVLTPTFWTSLRSALCPQDKNPSVVRKIHSQVCKILLKLDPKQTFQIAQRHFVRVFDQHWSAQDLDIVAEVLSHPLDRRPSPDGTDGSVWIRYDVLMRLLFGAPELRDARALQGITAALCRSSASWRDELSERVHGTGHQHGKKLTYQHVYELLCGRSAPPPINVTEFLYLVAHVQDDPHHGTHRVDVHKLWMLLNEDAKSPHKMPRTTGGDTQPFTLLRRCLRVLLDDHGLEKAIARCCRHEQDIVRVDDLTNELDAQLRVLKLSAQERDLVSLDQIRAFLKSLTRSSDRSSLGGELLYAHTLMDAVFDWDSFTLALRLPDRLVDVKKILELFDWDKDGSIDADDWAKAWRQLTIRTRSEKQQSPPPLPLQDWEIRVLVHRFPAGPSETRSRRSAIGLGAIEYSRLLVFLLDRQQRTVREQLKDAVVLLLQKLNERVTQGSHHTTTFHLEKAFEEIDRDGKGYFHIGDLRQFVLRQLEEARDTSLAVDTLQAYANQGPALEAVMAFLVGAKEGHKKKQVVSLMRFQELMNHGVIKFNRHHVHRHRRSRRTCHHAPDEDEYDTGSADDETSECDRRGRSFSPRIGGQITLLRDLEQCILDIAKPFVDAQGQLSPASAYAHLNGSSNVAKTRRPRSQSPLRSSRPPDAVSLSASYTSSSSRRSSCTTPRTTADAAAHEPLTASRLKQTLRKVHGIEASTHLIGQFFLRLGASTKHFLELSLFAKWLAPLSLELQSRVKQIVREMLVKSKSGGGHVDLERFIGAVERRLADARATEEAMVGRHGSVSRESFSGRTVRPGELLTRLHQLNVSLRKWEMVQLLRHFGMDDQHEIDGSAFLRKIHELGQQLPVHGDR
jgi:Ca2+-binding EF-hand superfamily protein